MAFERSDNNFKKITGPRRVGSSDIYILPTPSEHWARIRIPMPPSCNARQIPIYGRGRRADGRATLRLALTAEARGYLANALALRIGWRQIMNRPLEEYAEFHFQFFLGNMRYDTHNGLKLACDLIEKSGLILNDRFILPQVLMPIYAPTDPRLIIDFPLPQAGNDLSQEDVPR